MVASITTYLFIWAWFVHKGSAPHGLLTGHLLGQIQWGFEPPFSQLLEKTTNKPLPLMSNIPPQTQTHSHRTLHPAQIYDCNSALGGRVCN